MLFHKSKLTYKKVPMVIAYKEISAHPIINVFGEDGIFTLAVSTEFNDQTLFLIRQSPKLTPLEYRDTLKYLMELMLSKITTYNTILQMDNEYKLHEQHPLITGRLY